MKDRNSRDTQFQGFAHALYMECCNIYQEEMLKGPLRGTDQLVILNIARRAYDLVFWTLEKRPNSGDPRQTIRTVQDMPELLKED